MRNSGVFTEAQLGQARTEAAKAALAGSGQGSQITAAGGNDEVTLASSLASASLVVDCAIESRSVVAKTC